MYALVSARYVFYEGALQILRAYYVGVRGRYS